MKAIALSRDFAAAELAGLGKGCKILPKKELKIFTKMFSSCDECVPYPGCVNGGCNDKPYQCICNPGWQGKLCDQPEVN